MVQGTRSAAPYRDLEAQVALGQFRPGRLAAQRRGDAGLAGGGPPGERREQLAATLAAHRGNVSAIARSLGKARSQVQRWSRDHGLDPDQYRDPRWAEIE
jgi:transcriptional regulator of acetoin/glycerol metabolism